MLDANEPVFTLLEDLNVPLINRMALATREDELSLFFSIEKLYGNPLKDFEFFKKNQYLYETIQNGEFLSFNNLDSSKPILAYRKSPNLSGEHELLLYVPDVKEG